MFWAQSPALAATGLHAQFMFSREPHASKGICSSFQIDQKQLTVPYLLISWIAPGML